ncbi:uncharacterized protein LOC144606158 [Rhinoraja longicauda]
MALLGSKDLGMESTSLDDVLCRYASFRNLVDPITHELIVSLARYIHCPKPEGDAARGLEKICRQLTHHLSPHSRCKRQGLLQRKPQACLKAVLSASGPSESLDLSGITLSGRDLQRVALYLRESWETLCSVELGFVELTDEGFLQLLPTLASLPSLCTLSLNGNKLTRAVLRELTDTLKDLDKFPSITWIDLGNNVDIYSLPQPFLVSLRRRIPKHGNLPTIPEFAESQSSDPEDAETDRCGRLDRGAMPALEPGTEPALEQGTVPALEQGTVPALEQGTMPGLEHGTVPGLEHGTVPALEHGSVPALEHGTEPALEHGTVPWLEHGTVPGLEHGTEPALEHGSVPALEHGTVPALEHGTVPGLEHGTEPAMHHGTGPALEHGTVPGLEPGTEQRVVQDVEPFLDAGDEGAVGVVGALPGLVIHESQIIPVVWNGIPPGSGATNGILLFPGLVQPLGSQMIRVLWSGAVNGIPLSRGLGQPLEFRIIRARGIVAPLGSDCTTGVGSAAASAVDHCRVGWAGMAICPGLVTLLPVWEPQPGELLAEWVHPSLGTTSRSH